MNVYLIHLLLCIPAVTCALFEYDRAVHAAQSGQWENARTMFSSLVTDFPDRPDIVYDAGVVASNQGDYKQAEALFGAAAQNKEAPRDLKMRAYFNKGNAQVKQEAFKDALLSYENVLTLDAENEQAKHNYEVVRQLLDQQQQQQQESSDDQKKQDDQSEQSEQEKNKNECGDGDDCQGDDTASQDGSDNSKSSDSQPDTSDQKEQDGKGDQAEDEGFDDQGDDKEQQQGGPDNEQRKPEQNEQRDARDSAGDRSENQKQKDQEQKDSEHEKPLHDDTSTPLEDMQAKQKEQEQQEVVVDDSPLDPRMQEVLAKREQRDAQSNKRLIKKLVGKEIAGQDGQNSW